MKRVLTPKEIDAMVFDHFDFQGEWFDAFSKPEKTGTWFIAGNTSNGKSSFSQKLTKYLADLGNKVLIAPLEEGGRSTLQNSLRKINMTAVSGKVQFCPANEPIMQSIARLKKRNAAKILVIDSWQYAGLSFSSFKKTTEDHPDVLFIIISQAIKGKLVGSSAGRVELHADLKIWVEGHRAISKGRYIGTKGYYTNWHEGALKYWGAAQ